MAPSPDEIGRQLERLLASDPFANAERVSRFLRYVVERTLAGEGDRLKEFVIGVDVFDRDDTYDPRIDSIVRVEAGRLRSKLDQYYSRATADDTVVIRIQRGGYVPEFEARQTVAEAPPLQHPPKRVPANYMRAVVGLFSTIVAGAVLAWAVGMSPRARAVPLVTIAVPPLQHFSTETADQLLAARVTDGITSELARIGGVGVVSRTTALRAVTAGPTLRDVAKALGVDVVVEGSVISDDDGVHVDVRLVDTIVDRKTWGGRYSAVEGNLGALQQQVAAGIATAALAPRQR
jgi:TolB-like protein